MTQFSPPPLQSPPPHTPPRTSPLAIVSLICGIVSYFCLSLLGSIPAVVCGHMAMGQIRRDPNTGGRGLALAGLILGYINVALSVVAIAILYAGLLRARQTTERVACMSNLRQVSLALHMYANDNRGYLPADLSQLDRYLRPAGQTPPGVTPTNVMDCPVHPGTAPSYELLTPHLRLNRLREPDKQAVLWEILAHPDGRRNVGYADGRVEAIDARLPKPAPPGP